MTKKLENVLVELLLKQSKFNNEMLLDEAEVPFTAGFFFVMI